MKTKKMNEEEKHSSSFFNGLTLGAFFGAAFFFLFGTKKGRKVKKKLAKKGKEFWAELEEVIEEIKKDPDFLAKKTKKLTDQIEKKTELVKEQVEKKVEETKEVAARVGHQATAKALEQVEKVEKAALVKTKQARHFFQRGGKSLGK